MGVRLQCRTAAKASSTVSGQRVRAAPQAAATLLPDPLPRPATRPRQALPSLQALCSPSIAAIILALQEQAHMAAQSGGAAPQCVGRTGQAQTGHALPRPTPRPPAHRHGQPRLSPAVDPAGKVLDLVGRQLLAGQHLCTGDRVARQGQRHLPGTLRGTERRGDVQAPGPACKVAARALRQGTCTAHSSRSPSMLP